MRPWTYGFPCLSFNFLIYKMGLIMLCVSMELQAKGHFLFEPWVAIHSALHPLPRLPAAIGASFKPSDVCLRGSALPCLPTDTPGTGCSSQMPKPSFRFSEDGASQLLYPRSTFFPPPQDTPHLLQGLLRKLWGSETRLKAPPPPLNVPPSPCHPPPGSRSHHILPQA